jgi:hypothetical protein
MVLLSADTSRTARLLPSVSSPRRGQIAVRQLGRPDHVSATQPTSAVWTTRISDPRGRLAVAGRKRACCVHALSVAVPVPCEE